MSFISIQFFVFLFVTALIYYLIPGKYQYLILLAAGYFFYYLAGGMFVVFLLGIAVIAYAAGLYLDSSSDQPHKNLVTGIAVGAMAALLGYFKYMGFLAGTLDTILNALHLPETGFVNNIVLPAGISFFLFQAMGYVIDCRRGKIPAEKNFLMIALFICFFPTVLSGPIERAGNLLPQFKEGRKFNYGTMRDGLLIMLWGFFQKIIIADRLAMIVDTVYSDPASFPGTVCLLTSFLYTFEIYCDFAGYSNIAVGTAKVLGIDVMNNFRYPYLASGIAQFWRNWHISLSSWFRDYVYISLGGNRKGKTRKLINIMIVFAVSGLWHGAAWTFVFWGFLHGAYQVAGVLLTGIRDRVVRILKIDRNSFSHKLVKIFITFNLVNIGWVFFRADTFSKAAALLKNACHLTPWVLTDGTLFHLGLSEQNVRLAGLALLILIFVDICNYRGICVREKITQQSLWLRWLIYITAAVFIITCGIWGPGYNAASFIYSQF